MTKNLCAAIRLALVALSLIAGSGNALTASPKHSYQLSDRGVLVLTPPGNWKEQVQRLSIGMPPTIRFQPDSGAPFEVLISAAWPMKAGVAVPTIPDIRRTVSEAAERVKAQSNEKSIDVVEANGPFVRGFYFRESDKAPKPGEYKYLIQGMLGLDRFTLTFTVLTNDGQGAVANAAMEMLRNAQVAPLPPSPAPAKKVASIPPPDATDLRDLLANGKIEELDAELTAYQTAYRAGEITEREAAQGIRSLDRTDPALQEIYARWIATKPASYAARVARARYLVDRGYEARGTDYANKTSKAQIDAMKALFGQAKDDLAIARVLDTKPTLIYSSLIYMSMGLGDQEEIARAIGEAIALDPNVYTARAAYLGTLSPEWGGSVEQLQAAVAEWKWYFGEDGSRQFVQSLEDAQWREALRPAKELYEKKKYQGAIGLLDQILAKTKLVRALSMRGASYAALGNHQKAIEDFTQALELDPDSTCCLNPRVSRAKSYQAIGAFDKAMPDLITASTKHDNAWATRELAEMYLRGINGAKVDYAAALRWCERSAKQGDPMSMFCIGGMYDQGLGVKQDFKTAALWYGRAADGGIADAQADYAYMLWNGQGLAPDRPRAIRYWLAATKKGNARARGELDGHLGPNARSADGRIADLQTEYADLLWNGGAITQDRPRAIKYWAAAAMQGSSKAQGELERRLGPAQYLLNVTYPAWVESQKRDHPWIYFVISALGLAWE